jgi:diguanylate cyclase (GGDEF)-like protein/PAS domain S-box-containing protein
MIREKGRKASAALHNSSIRVKLSLLMALNTSLALLLAGIGFVGYELYQSRDIATREAKGLGAIVSANSTAALSFGDQVAAGETLAALRGDQRLVQAALYDRDGRLFASYGSTEPAVVPTRLLPYGCYFENGSILLFGPVLLRGERLGTVFLEMTLNDVYSRLRRYCGIVSIVLLVSLGLALLLSARLQRVISAPIAALGRIARLVSAEKNYSLRATKHADDEIGLLIDSFNEMLLQLEMRELARIAAERLLRESEERYALAARGANDGLWDWKLDTNEIYFSPRWNQMLGYSPYQIWSDPEEWFSRIHPTDRDRVRSAIAAHCEGRASEFASEYRMLHKNGSYIWMLSRGIAVRDVNGTAVRMAGSQTDITEGKVGDPLTELPNRLYFMDKLEAVQDAAGRSENRLFAVLFLDLDRFKIVNDSQGHAVGDQLLIEVAQRLRSTVRATDLVGKVISPSTVARLGGDEFAILLEDVRNEAGAANVAERILKQLNSPITINGRAIHVSVSIGIALSSSGAMPAEVLRNADTAMYHAKATGKARFEVFNEGMRERAVARMETESDLRHGLAAGELAVYYQPKVCLDTRRITGFEALARWNHPSRGLLYPSEFIPVAEETELILPLGVWVLREACRQMAQWQKNLPLAHALTISVNVSFKQLAEPGLVENVECILAETGLDPSYLKLELTESSIMENAENALATLRRLKKMKIGLEIDDFGTGYSSLSHLRQLPFDTVKIDRSFVKELGAGGQSSEIINTILKLARSLSMNVVAEGIESKDQLALLTGLGCSHGQGYYFSEPVTAERAEQLVQDDSELLRTDYLVTREVA